MQKKFTRVCQPSRWRQDQGRHGKRGPSVRLVLATHQPAAQLRRQPSGLRTGASCVVLPLKRPTGQFEWNFGAIVIELLTIGRNETDE